jgi:hypothetical protein
MTTGVDVDAGTAYVASPGRGLSHIDRPCAGLDLPYSG